MNYLCVDCKHYASDCLRLR